MTRLKGKRCLITGAASGLGEAISRSFAANGASVIVTDIDAVRGQRVADQISGRFLKLDVSCQSDWDQIELEFPTVNVVVNNAGITGYEIGKHGKLDPENCSLEEWHRVHSVNLDGTFLGCRYAIRAMRKSRLGSIINMSSRSGIVGVPNAAAYASSKAAIRNHTKTVALYCASQGLEVRCNSIHPAAIDTPMWDSMIGSDTGSKKRRAAIVEGIPLQRFGDPADVAAVAVMLASDEATFVTGSEITIDGGILAGSSSAPGD